MLVKKVFNNNVVMSRDEFGRDVVVMGRGIAFKKRPGDSIEPGLIDKIFHQSQDGMASRLVDLLSEIPLEYFALTEEIIREAKGRLGKKLNDSLVISLTDHLFYAIKRFREGQIIRNGLLWEIKRLYREEYEFGKYVIELIAGRYDLQLPEDEAASVALHLINAQLGEEIPTVMAMTKVMQSVMEIVRMHFMIEPDEDALSYYRFITHLKFFSQRLVTGNFYSEPTDMELYDFIKTKYPSAFQCTERIVRYIQSEFKYKLTSEEMLYITVHIERLMKNTSRSTDG